jgi:hypothetical protein
MKKHANQVAAWGKLLGHCNALGDSYKPGKDSMKGTALENLLAESVNQVEAVHIAETFLRTAITDRQEAFIKLPFIGTRVVGALEALGASLEQINDVNAFRKRFRYQSPPKEVTARNAIPGGQAGNPGAEDPPTSVKRKLPYGDFESKIDNFQLMINQLENITDYAPAQADIAIPGLKQFLAVLKQRHEAVAQAQLQLHLARTKRNELLYGRNGMYTISRMVKKYFQSTYGFQSIEFRTVRKIKFHQ